MKTLFSGLPRKRAETYGLVLSALGIEHRLQRQSGGWCLLVRPADYEKALAAVDLYRQENPPPPPRRDAAASGCGRTWTGIGVAVLLLAVHVAVDLQPSRQPVTRFYGASAEHILDGEVYRCVTALMLHADALHLAANMAGIALFGTAVCSLAGWGVGWLMMLLAGAAGNLLNAVFFQTQHLSIGASTAVFGAIGILSGAQFVRKIKLAGQRAKALLPMGGGLALLGFLGSAAHSDVTAHLFGFISGIAMGGGWAALTDRPTAETYQILSACLAVGLLALAWLA